MDKRVLDQWADLLLDTGKRNQLIHFRDTKSSTAEVLLPEPALLFDRLAADASFFVFDPGTADDGTATNAAEMPDGAAAAAPRAEEKLDYLARCRDRMSQKDELLMYNSSQKPLKALRNIAKRARAFLDETGVNVSYLSFGLVHWRESDSSDIFYQAPALLVPVRISQASAFDPWCLTVLEDEKIVNPTFSYKMEAEYGARLPEYADESLPEYLGKVRQQVCGLQWTVSDECRLGIFSFLKINMYRDLKDNADAILESPVLRQVTGDGYAPDSVGLPGAARVKNPLIDLHTVVDADSSQLEAVRMAKEGQSFVLQGPPGTGKSQTITNMIAELLHDGKKVLFVSEKSAALNVVWEKLRQAGLSDFCLELHSHKANKKDVIDVLYQSLQPNQVHVPQAARAEIAVKAQAQAQLDAYVMALHQKRPGIDKSLYQLYEAYAAYRTAPDVYWPIPGIEAKSETDLPEPCGLLEQYAGFSHSVGYDYRQSPWRWYNGGNPSRQERGQLQSDLCNLVSMLRALDAQAGALRERYGICCNSISQAQFWRRFFGFCVSEPYVTPRLLEKEAFLKLEQQLPGLQRLSAELRGLKTEIDAEYDEDIYRLDGSSMQKKLQKQFSRPADRMFRSEYGQMLSELRLYRRDGKKPHYRQALAIAGKLAAYEQNLSRYQTAQSAAQELLGEAKPGKQTDWDALASRMPQLRCFVFSGVSFGRLPSLSGFAAELDQLSAAADRLSACLELCPDAALAHIAGCFDARGTDVRDMELAAALQTFGGCLEQEEALDGWCHCRAVLCRLRDAGVLSFLDTALDRHVDPSSLTSALKKQFYEQWIDLILSGNPTLSSFNRIAQDKAVETFAEKDREQFELNKAKIRSALFAQRPSLDCVVHGSDVSVLVREHEKKKKKKSIRNLMESIGGLAQQLRPCFLMSPLSVSTFLPSGAVGFDTVIFDEASQIFPQDAVGAIYRGRQLIVVGDSRQMPPSNFFRSAQPDAEEDETEDVTDFESILDLCATNFRQLRLRWHYRSRYEPLIAFSNRYFYENSLITFPSVRSDAAGIGVDFVFANGTYDRKSRTNQREAELVVDLIYQNLERYPERSLGVVAFSIAQQELIDDLLSQKRRRRPDQEDCFRADRQEPFFIKNLETVQGDERDTILFSIAYGPDAQGRLLYNFGPLSRAGGERRLNVAVTRAKSNVQVVSSMRPSQIDLTRTTSTGARLLREYLAFAESGPSALEKSLSVGSTDVFDSDFEMEVCEFLRANGFSVDTQIGCSGFRIDLGLKRPDSSDYVLAIECDGAAYHSCKNARDRDRLRQDVLERMGWRFYRIWSTDWFRNKPVEQKRLLEAAESAIRAAAPECRADATGEQPTVDRSSDSGVTEPDRRQSPKSLHPAHRELQVPPMLFPPYVSADLEMLRGQYLPQDFKGFVRAVLEVEAPLSEELLLKRIVWYFQRERVTSVVRTAFARAMRGCQSQGIIRRKRFLYLSQSGPLQLRAAGDLVREMQQIALEELAAGMLAIVRQNHAVDKTEMYRQLAQQCGFSRLGQASCALLDNALKLLGDQVCIQGTRIGIQ